MSLEQINAANATAARGDCFPTAWRIVYESTDPSYRVCHGTVTGQGPIEGVRHAHAWVEYTETHDVPLWDGSGTRSVTLTAVIDRANGNDLLMPATMYYKIGEPADVERYDRDEAIRLALTTGQYGPWQ